MSGRYLAGEVVEGKKLGRTIGFPTANLLVNERFLQEQGVYAVHVYHHYRRYRGIMNIGTRPSFKDGTHATVEVHIIGLDENLYGEMLYVEKVAMLRGEQAFSNIEALKAQLTQDKEEALKVLSEFEELRRAI